MRVRFLSKVIQSGVAYEAGEELLVADYSGIKLVSRGLAEMVESAEAIKTLSEPSEEEGAIPPPMRTKGLFARSKRRVR